MSFKQIPYEPLEQETMFYVIRRKDNVYFVEMLYNLQQKAFNANYIDDRARLFTSLKSVTETLTELKALGHDVEIVPLVDSEQTKVLDGSLRAQAAVMMQEQEQEQASGYVVFNQTNGKYVESFNPITGEPSYVDDESEAKRYPTAELAMLAAGNAILITKMDHTAKRV